MGNRRESERERVRKRDRERGRTGRGTKRLCGCGNISTRVSTCNTKGARPVVCRGLNEMKVERSVTAAVGEGGREGGGGGLRILQRISAYDCKIKITLCDDANKTMTTGLRPAQREHWENTSNTHT